MIQLDRGVGRRLAQPVASGRSRCRSGARAPLLPTHPRLLSREGAGGVSGAGRTDLVGYDKDVEERVLSVVGVTQRLRRREGRSDELCTTMLELIDYHDGLLAWIASELERGAGAWFVAGCARAGRSPSSIANTGTSTSPGPCDGRSSCARRPSKQIWDGDLRSLCSATALQCAQGLCLEGLVCEANVCVMGDRP